MSNHQASLDPHPPKPTRKALWPALTLAAALLAGVAGTLASPAAQAVPGGSFTVSSQSSGAAAPHPGLQAIPFHPGLDATAPAPELGRTLSVARPRDASTGLFIAGPVSATVSGSEADMQATAIINERTSGTSGTLTLDLIATTSPPPVGAISGAFLLASFNLGTLAAQTELTNVNTGEIPFTGPSAGCYYISLLLLENGDVVDVRTLPAGGTPETTGYSEFGFGETCPAATSCTRTANSVCLDSSRFQVTVVYDNTTTGAGVGQVLLFGSTRAESDESGFFYFTDASNFELGAKVLDACTVNNAFWVFIGGLTNQGWSLNVLDTQTARAKFYGNADGTTTVTTTDTAAFSCP
jgi:hypothetical protein